MFRTHSIRVGMRVACLLFATCLAVARPLAAQSTFGTILGTVRDASGALVPGAQLTLLNTGTQGARSATTDGSGDYAFRNIDVGAYALTIAAPGFQTQTLPDISRVPFYR